MIALLLSFALGLEPLTAGGAFIFENIAVVPPAGWIQPEQGEDLLLKPGDLGAEESFVVVIGHESDEPAGTLAEGLEQSWQAFNGTGSVVIGRSPASEIKTAAGAIGLSASGTLEARGRHVFVTVAVFKPKDRYRFFASLATTEAAAEKYHAAFADIVNSVEFRNDAASKPNLPAGPTPAVSSSYELLLTFGSGLSASSTGGSDYGAGSYVYCVFADGTWLATAPSRGLNHYDLAADQRSRSADFGTWQRDSNGVLALRTPYRFETLYPQADSNYLRKDTEAREATYFRIPTSTGLQFSGRYIKEGQSDGPDTVSITFRRDGTFEDNGVVHMILPDEIGVGYRDISEVLGPGSGTYEIANNTLTLAYGDGRRKPILFILTPELAAKKDPDAIYMGKVWFKRS